MVAIQRHVWMRGVNVRCTFHGTIPFLLQSLQVYVMQRVGGLGNPRHVVLPGHRRQIALSVSKSPTTGTVAPFHVLRRNNHGFLGGNTVPVVGNVKRLQLREVRYLIPVSTIIRLNGVII